VATQDSILLNAGFGVYVYGLAASIEDGVALARKVLYSGAAIQTLDKWIATTQKINGK
jgi:anthranilate phosphoribosyltransferase